MPGVDSLMLPRRTLAALCALVLAAVSLTAPVPLGGRPAAHAGQALNQAAAAVDSALEGIADAAVKVIVQKRDTPRSAPADSPESVVADNGGQVTKDLAIVNGFAATVPPAAIDALAQHPGVRAITLDRVMQVQSNPGGSSGNVKSVYRKSVRADALNNAGFTGRGVTVALIDTGVTEVADLAGRLVTVTDDMTGASAKCQNMSGEPHCDDSFGHGTFIAGIIAGNGALSGGVHKGVAPEANLLSVKIAGRSGSADVSSVLAAIQWVVAMRDRYGVKVLNLSLGTNSTQSYRVDPLNYAVEKAWFAGITVVVSASNRGPEPRTIAKPGDDPFVITVGAVDDRGTNATSDDSLPNFTSRGPTAADGIAKPDVTAPGAHVVSLRAPGSAVDVQFPNYVDDHYRKASGTSFSAGVVSGAAALISQVNRAATPDRIKHMLSSTARKVASNDAMAVGAGEVDAYGAGLGSPPGLANVGVEPGNGSGTIDASRGTVYVSATDPGQTVVNGSLTLQLLVYNPLGLFADWTGSNWYGSNWYGSNWYGSNWYGSNWYGSNWYGSQWDGSNWYGSNWYGTLDGSNWYGSNWYGSNWYGGWE